MEGPRAKVASQVQLHWEQGMGMQRVRTTGRPWSCSLAVFPKHYRQESPWPWAIYPLGFTLSQVWGRHCELSKP